MVQAKATEKGYQHEDRKEGKPQRKSDDTASAGGRRAEKPQEKSKRPAEASTSHPSKRRTIEDKPAATSDAARKDSHRPAQARDAMLIEKGSSIARVDKGRDSCTKEAKKDVAEGSRTVIKAEKHIASPKESPSAALKEKALNQKEQSSTIPKEKSSATIKSSSSRHQKESQTLRSKADSRSKEDSKPVSRGDGKAQAKDTRNPREESKIASQTDNGKPSRREDTKSQLKDMKSVRKEEQNKPLQKEEARSQTRIETPICKDEQKTSSKEDNRKPPVPQKDRPASASNNTKSKARDIDHRVEPRPEKCITALKETSSKEHSRPLPKDGSKSAERKNADAKARDDKPVHKESSLRNPRKEERSGDKAASRSGSKVDAKNSAGSRLSPNDASRRIDHDKHHRKDEAHRELRKDPKVRNCHCWEPSRT